MAAKVASGETVTLLCSSACDDESRCHRAVLRNLVEKAAAATEPVDDKPKVVRREKRA